MRDSELLTNFAEGVMDEAHWLQERADEDEVREALCVVGECLGQLEHMASRVDGRARQ
jgi:hypothetical protein